MNHVQDFVVPTIIGGAPVILYSRIDERHTSTEACRHFVDGQLIGPAWGLAICQFDGDDGFYLFRCSDDFTPVTDTYHDSIEEAKEQAEAEYRGVSQTWEVSTK